MSIRILMKADLVAKLMCVSSLA
uniref:Uncharacterized protein n=1 Tax=Anguilla anguilla TaxID=7936 RepID=A0A0E9UKY4_ANGAN